MPEIRLLVSYAGRKEGNYGYIYQATNWLYTGKQGESFMKWCNGKHARHQERYDSEYKQLISAKYRYIYHCRQKVKERYVEKYSLANNK